MPYTIRGLNYKPKPLPLILGSSMAFKCYEMTYALEVKILKPYFASHLGSTFRSLLKMTP